MGLEYQNLEDEEFARTKEKRTIQVGAYPEANACKDKCNPAGELEEINRDDQSAAGHEEPGKSGIPLGK